MDWKKTKFWLLPVGVLSGLLVWQRIAPGQDSAAALDPAVRWQGEPPTRTLTDGNEIFHKAFWRRPSAEDEVLHGERHEWSDAQGLVKWEWFLVVKASPALLKDLLDDRFFRLMPESSLARPPQAPAWFNFAPGGVYVFQSRSSRLRLIIRNSDQMLYATDSGQGFTEGAVLADPPMPSVPVPGRLPKGSPPGP